MKALPLLVLVGLAYSQTGRDAPPPLGSLVDAGGYRVHLFCSGAGPQTVMIVGAGGSFDWGLVQPEIARFARVCSYDPAGTAWSDPSPEVNCSQRIDEIHAVLKRAGIGGRLILVGHSLGAAIARLYASRYPREVAGMVVVDHVGSFRVAPGTPVAPPGALRDDDPVQKLPPLDQRLHRWAASLPQRTPPVQAIFQLCRVPLEETTNLRPDPLGNIPLVVVSNGVFQNSPDYRKLQNQLLALSHNSREIVAEKSGHAIPMDQPEVIVTAVRQVIAALMQAQLQK